MRGLGPKSIQQWALVNLCSPHVAVGRAVHQVQSVLGQAMDPLHEHNLVYVTPTLPLKVGFHNWLVELSNNRAGFVVEQGCFHGVGATGVSLVEEQQQAMRSLDHSIFVLNAVGPKQPAAPFIQHKLIVYVVEVVSADSPGQPRLRGRQVGVSHNEMLGALAGDPLNPRVFVARNTVITGQRQLVPEVITASVFAGENQDVGDVVGEPRACPSIAAIAGAHPPGEEMKEAVVMQQASVENSAVTGNCIRAHQRLRQKSLDERRGVGRGHCRHPESMGRRARQPLDGSPSTIAPAGEAIPRKETWYDRN